MENNLNTICQSKIEFLGSKSVAIDEKYIFSLKMAILVNQNGHFEYMGVWLQILQIVGNSTLFYLSFDTHDSPGSVSFTIGFGNVGKNLSQISLCAHPSNQST